MDLIMSINRTSMYNRNYPHNMYEKGVIIELAICDRNYTPLFNERFRPERIREWKEMEKYHGISYDDVKNCCHFRDKVEEIKSILSGNRVDCFYAGLERDLLEQTCKEERINHQWVDKLEISSYQYRVCEFYDIFTSDYKPQLNLSGALDLSIKANENLKLKQPEFSKDQFSKDQSAISNCIKTAFVINVTEENKKRRLERERARIRKMLFGNQ